MDMPPPHTLKWLRSLQGKLQLVCRFISQLLEKYQVFTHLHKDESFKWDPMYQRSFEKIKEYLANSPILVLPMPWHPLILYTSATTIALRELLAQLDDNGK